MRYDFFSPKVRWMLKAAFVILWLFAMVAAYFWVHKPFDAEIVAGLSQSLSGIVAWLGITWLGVALGRWVGHGLLVDELPGTRLVLSAGIGLGLLSLLTLGLGLIGLLRPVIAWTLVLGLGVLLWRHLWASLADLGDVKLSWPANGFQRWLAIYSVASLSLSFLVALAPPMGWDTLAYHLTGPRLFVEAGRMVHPVDLPHLGFPQLGEMQFTLGLLLVGERLAPLFHFGYGLLALAITALLAQCIFDRNVVWLAVALLLSVPTLLSLMTRAYVDVALLFYATAAFYAFYRWREAQAQEAVEGPRGWLLTMGLFCGFCGGVKYTAVAIPVALGLSLIWVSRRDGLRKVVGQLALVALVAAVAVLPWLLENLLTTGNPFYPFFFPGGVYWDQWRDWWLGQPGTGLAATAPWRLLTAPLEATILGTEGTVLYEATIGPLLLPSMMLLVFIWRGLNQEERAVVGHMLLFFGVNYALWLNGLARTARLLRSRFLFLVFGIVAVLGGAALSRLRILNRPELSMDWLIRAVVSLTLALLLFSMTTEFLEANPLPVILGLESRDDYLTRRLGWYYPAIQYINQKLPLDVKVLFLWEPRTYHCQKTQCWPDAMLDRFLHSTHLYGYKADRIASAWQAEGVTHVLLHQAGLDLLLEQGFDPITSKDLEVLNGLQTQHATLIKDFGSAYKLYRLQ